MFEVRFSQITEPEPEWRCFWGYKVSCQLTGTFYTKFFFRYTKALVSIKNLRKDRTAELKAENERLLSLSREKSHLDKLMEHLAKLNAQIAAKEVEYEEKKQEYDSVAEANRKFYEYNTEFLQKLVAATLNATLAELTLPGNIVFIAVMHFLTFKLSKASASTTM